LLGPDPAAGGEDAFQVGHAIGQAIPTLGPSAKKMASSGVTAASPRSVLAAAAAGRVAPLSITKRSFSNRALVTPNVGDCAASCDRMAAALGRAEAKSVWIRAERAFVSTPAVRPPTRCSPTRD